MMTRNLFSHCATVAIAASVAIPALAQDASVADPVIVLPPETAPATSAPQITLPEPVAEASAPVLAQVPEPVATTAAPAPVAISPRSAATTPVRTTASTPVQPAQAEPVSISGSASDADTPVVAAAPAQPVTSPSVTAPTVAPSPVAATVANDTDELALAGMLGALGLVAVGGIAFAASRRRRNSVQTDEIYGPVAYDPVDEPIVETPVVVAPQPVMTQAAYTTPAPKAPVMARHTGVGDPVALPAELPETFEERDALLHELVAAKPDKANPFTSPRARARRAKLIMQSLGRSFKDRKPRIDLSEYTNRWPSLRGWQPATA